MKWIIKHCTREHLPERENKNCIGKIKKVLKIVFLFARRWCIFIFLSIQTFVFSIICLLQLTMYFRALDTVVLSQCGTCLLLLYCPCSVSRQTSWWSVYLLTCALWEQCRQCWQIRREPWPRTSALKANWCLQAESDVWGIVLILTLIIVLVSVSTAGDFRHIPASADKWRD